MLLAGFLAFGIFLLIINPDGSPLTIKERFRQGFLGMMALMGFLHLLVTFLSAVFG